jgi:exodeoxyribonuclease V alpha subunit
VSNLLGEVKVERFDWTDGLGDKATQIAGDYDQDVFNGDLSVMDRIDTVILVGGLY